MSSLSLPKRSSKVRILPGNSPEAASPQTESGIREEAIDDASIVSATTLAKEINDWIEGEWSEGTKGPLSAAVARRWVTVVKQTNTGPELQEEGWLLLERQGAGLKTWISWAVEDWFLDELVTYAHMRWPIEQFHRDTKQVISETTSKDVRGTDGITTRC